MGIPRLQSDLLPYAETVRLGRHNARSTSQRPAPGKDDLLSIMKVVIDGPSLVYQVCHNLYASRHVPSSRSVLVEYADINAAIRKALQELERVGVEIVKIVFDGALPISKRSIRLERLESTRRDLEAFRKAHPQGPFDGGNAATRLSAKQTGSLPHPPFMVASAIEDLRMSEWSAVLEMVPGEADGWCASWAMMSNAAVITNDSDLTMYDVDVVILLHSLIELLMTTSNCGWLKAQCFRPKQIAQRMGLKSLRTYGYERIKDETATGAIIKERTRAADTTLETYKTFEVQFETMSILENPKIPVSSWNADPRVTEVICQLWDPEAKQMHVYLPVLLEDPSRDAAWSCGAGLRQTAYTLLASSLGRSKNIEVMEYIRKGARIAATPVLLLDRDAVEQNLQDLSQVLQLYLDDQQSATYRTFMSWLVALHILHDEKIAKGAKLPLSFVHRTLAIGSRHCALTWDDIHMHANVQAILYSLRIIPQLAPVATLDKSTFRALSEWPRLAEMLLGPSALQRVIRAIDPTAVQEKMSILIGRMDTGQFRQQTADETILRRSTSSLGATDATLPTSSTWSVAKSKRTRRVPGVSVDEAVRNTYNGSNSFSLLQNGN